MVSYQTMISLAFKVAKSKGAKFDSIQDGAEFTSQLADYWQNNKQQLKQMTESQTRKRLEEIVEP